MTSDLRYDREVLTTVLIYHARTDTSGCHCGWAVLGASYADHVADVYEQSVAQSPAPPASLKRIEWADVQAGDAITLLVFDMQEGLVRERRTVVAVDWPTITLAEGGRVYDVDATAPDKVDRQIQRDVRLAGD